MASKIKADQFETLDGSGNITLNNSVTMASTKTLPAASLTGALPAISAAALTSIPAGNLTGTVADARISTLTASKLTGALPAISGANLTGVTSVGGATGADFNDNTKLRWGTGNDLEIYHDGTNSYIDNNTGALFMRNNGSLVFEDLSGNNMIRAIDGGAVDLYYDGTSKLTTSSAGGTLTGAWSGVGKVLQMTYGPASEPSGMSTSSTDFVVVFSHTITPSATSSKIHISAFSNGQDASAGRIMDFTIYRAIDGGATTNLDGSGADNSDGFGMVDSSTNIAVPITIMYLDSPSTTSEITYSFRVRSAAGAGNVEITGGIPQNFILTEIAG